MSSVNLREQTQSNTDPGNCWQTAVACLLEVEAATLPDQVAIEAAGDNYNNRLLSYLDLHHGLIYGEVYAWMHPALWPVGFHLLIGPTVRTLPPPDDHVHHVVVGWGGVMLWDPHPSRAGLLSVAKWGILAPMPPDIQAQRVSMRERGVMKGCNCPACAA